MMRGFFATFRAAAKYLWRDPTSVTIMTLFPILLILILGSALGSYIAADTEIDPVPVAVSIDENGAFAAFLGDGDVTKYLLITKTDAQNARELTEAGDVEAAIIENGGEISVFRAAGSESAANVVVTIVDSYRQISAAATVAATRGDSFIEKLGLEIQVRETALGKRVPGSMDYYAITMLVMILMYSGLNGMELINKCIFSQTGQRIMLAPISRAAHIGGLLAASTAISYLQGMATFIFSGLVYGVYWGDRIPLVLLTLFFVVLFSQSLCICLAVIFKSPGAMNGVAQGLLWATTFVSKGYSKIDFGAAEEIFQYAPNAMAHTVVFGAIYGGDESRMAQCLLLLIAGCGALFAVSFLFGRRRLS